MLPLCSCLILPIKMSLVSIVDLDQTEFAPYDNPTCHYLGPVGFTCPKCSDGMYHTALSVVISAPLAWDFSATPARSVPLCCMIASFFMQVFLPNMLPQLLNTIRTVRWIATQLGGPSSVPLLATTLHLSTV